MGRFYQADTIVPDPSISTNWDRYQYVENNPVRYNDPSGHCKGNPDDPKNPDYQCWLGIDAIQFRFGVGIGMRERWSFSELTALYIALGAAYQVLGSKAFSNVFGGTNFYNINNRAGIFGMDMPPVLGSNGKTVLLSDDLLAGKNAVFDITHELGHVFDFNDTSGNPDKYKSDDFVDNFAPGCNTGMMGCLGTKPNQAYVTLNKITGGGGAKGYKVGSNDTTWYGRESGSLDDYADVWANVVLNKANLASFIPSDRTPRTPSQAWMDRLTSVTLDIENVKSH